VARKRRRKEEGWKKGKSAVGIFLKGWGTPVVGKKGRDSQGEKNQLGKISRKGKMNSYSLGGGEEKKGHAVRGVRQENTPKGGGKQENR